MKKTMLLLVLSLPFAAKVFAVYDPVACLDSLSKKGLNPCRSPEGSYACSDMPELGDVARHVCTQSGTYMPVQSTEAFNPQSGDRRNIENPDEMLAFLNANPEYEARPCYCCCE